MHKALLALVIAAAAVSNSAYARQLSYSDILGRWCGDASDYTFTHEALTVTLHAGGRNVLRVQRYEFGESWINVWWQPPHVNTVFAEFSADGRTMVQQANVGGDRGPRRVFRRC